MKAVIYNHLDDFYEAHWIFISYDSYEAIALYLNPKSALELAIVIPLLT